MLILPRHRARGAHPQRFQGTRRPRDGLFLRTAGNRQDLGSSALRRTKWNMLRKPRTVPNGGHLAAPATRRSPLSAVLSLSSGSSREVSLGSATRDRA